MGFVSNQRVSFHLQPRSKPIARVKFGVWSSWALAIFEPLAGAGSGPTRRFTLGRNDVQTGVIRPPSLLWLTLSDTEDASDLYSAGLRVDRARDCPEAACSSSKMGCQICGKL